MMVAAERGFPNIVQMLVNDGANPDIKNHAGETALDLAVKGNKEEVIAILDPITSGYWARRFTQKRYIIPAAIVATGAFYAGYRQLKGKLQVRR